MTLNLPPRVRLALYLLTVIGTPIAVYLQAKGIIGDLEFILWGAEVTAVTGLAAINTGNAKGTNEFQRILVKQTTALKGIERSLVAEEKASRAAGVQHRARG
jgi:hypothetical protein